MVLKYHIGGQKYHLMVLKGELDELPQPMPQGDGAGVKWWSPGK